MRCVLATCHPYLKENQPVASDDLLLSQALRQRGIVTEVVPWEQEHYPWSRADLVLIRSTWNYHLSYRSFLAWAAHVANVSTLLNPLAVVRWNTQKRRYLPALAAAGIPTIPTWWLEKRSSAHLGQILSTLGWNKAVLKPSIAANSYGTCVVEGRKRESVAQGQQHLDHFLKQQDMLLQPYLASVERFGENSHVFIHGSWSHAFAKLPFHTLTAEELLAHRPGAQQVDSCAPSGEVELAQRIMRVVEQVLGCSPLLYGRVDLVREEGRLYLMELELTEPVLHLEYADALQHLVEAIIARSWWLEEHHLVREKSVLRR